METQQLVQRMLETIIKINTGIYPFSLLIPISLGILFIIALIINLNNPNYRKTIFLKSIIVLCYSYAGIPLLLTTEIMGIQAIIGGLILLFLGLLFLISIFDKSKIYKLDNRLYIRIIGFVLMFVGIFLYPVIEYLTGHIWPEIAVFGMECPTTITVIGLLISTIKTFPKYLILILSLNAIFTGTSVALLGATFDWSYAIAGYLGFIILIMNWKRLKTSNL
ncbi:MAG: hypothetical protein EOL95_08375 [Bacteroidia bacterium]|nr:hypothetical protein [Bacteroidia bacterium]